MPAVLIYSPFFFSLFSLPYPFARKEKSGERRGEREEAAPLPMAEPARWERQSGCACALRERQAGRARALQERQAPCASRRAAPGSRTPMSADRRYRAVAR
jgi:hypothetical protein